MKGKEVVVIGSGAAGATAAFFLAKLDIKVTILEKNAENILKPCCGGIAASVQGLFPFDLKEVIAETINKVDFTYSLEDKVEANLPGSSPFWIVRREKLDELILDQAISSGAELIRSFYVNKLSKEGPTWKVSATDGREIVGKAIIIADGSDSPWPQKYNLGPKKLNFAFTNAIHIKSRGNLKPNTTRFDFGLFPYGYAWAFPICEGINIGLGTFIGSKQIDTKKILSKLLPNLGINYMEVKPKINRLRIWNGHFPLHGDGIVVIGDAASLCDPFLAEGLRPAIISGIEAAKSINSWLSKDCKDLKGYTENMRIRWGSSMYWGKKIAQVFYRFPKLGYKLGIKRPTAPKRIAEILSGEMGYGDIAQRVIRRLLVRN